MVHDATSTNLAEIEASMSQRCEPMVNPIVVTHQILSATLMAAKQ